VECDIHHADTAPDRDLFIACIWGKNSILVALPGCLFALVYNRDLSAAKVSKDELKSFFWMMVPSAGIRSRTRPINGRTRHFFCNSMTKKSFLSRALAFNGCPCLVEARKVCNFFILPTILKLCQSTSSSFGKSLTWMEHTCQVIKVLPCINKDFSRKPYPSCIPLPLRQPHVSPAFRYPGNVKAQCYLNPPPNLRDSSTLCGISSWWAGSKDWIFLL
jgi:hypothetical protein